MKAEYDPEDVLYVLDLGFEIEAEVLTDGMPSTLRLCVPCYRNQGRVRMGNKGDSFIMEDAVCMAHWSRLGSGISEEGYALPIGVRGRPATQLGPCKAEGCENPQRSKELCNKHYTAHIRHQQKEAISLE